MKVKILIVEDELIIAEDMRGMLERLGYEVVGVTGEPEEAQRILTATGPDIVMLDITLGTEQLGLDLAAEITEKFRIPFIFCTSHADQSTIDKAKRLGPSGYLVKPFDQNDLYSAIEISLANFSKNKVADQYSSSSTEDVPNMVIKDSLFIKESHLYVKVKIDNIYWLTADGNYTTIYEKDKKHLVRMTLKDLLDQLPKEHFFRTHRSHVVNLNHIEAINNQSVYIQSQQIPLGRNFRDELLECIRKMN